MAEDVETYVSRTLDYVQRNRGLRLGIAGIFVGGLLYLAGYFAIDLIPRTYSFEITGGSITGNRHYLAKVLQQEAEAYGVQMRIRPTAGTLEALELVDAGKLDLAFVQGGLDTRFPNVQHIATVGAELVHFFVKPGIEELSDLRGKVINVGTAQDGIQIIAEKILAFSSINSGVDYALANHSSEALLEMRADKLPDVIFHLSFAPSYLGDFLVRERGYKLLEVPFPAALTNRLTWVADKEILAYMYDVIPPVPDRDLRTVGVNLHLVGHTSIEPHAIVKVLEALFGPAVENRLRLRLDEGEITEPSGYPLSEGTVTFLNRNNPLFSADTGFYIESGIGLMMTGLSVILVLIRWFRGPSKEVENDDHRFHAFLAEVGEIERSLADMDAHVRVRHEDLVTFSTRLSLLKAEALESYSTAVLNDPSLVGTLISTVDRTRDHIDQLRLIFREG